ASHFQTVPTRRDATLFEVLNRAAIEHLGKRFKARRGLASRVVEQIRCVGRSRFANPLLVLHGPGYLLVSGSTPEDSLPVVPAATGFRSRPQSERQARPLRRRAPAVPRGRRPALRWKARSSTTRRSPRPCGPRRWP